MGGKSGKIAARMWQEVASWMAKTPRFCAATGASTGASRHVPRLV
jgi:hypothetical protein